MMLMVWPSALRQRIADKNRQRDRDGNDQSALPIPRGTSKIMIAVRHAAMIPSRMTPWMEARTKATPPRR